MRRNALTGLGTLFAPLLRRSGNSTPKSGPFLRAKDAAPAFSAGCIQFSIPPAGLLENDPRWNGFFMSDKELYFVIPTYRLRDVGQTVEQYDDHFWRNGQSVRTIVFDDSSPANQEKYFPLLEQTRTHQDLFYVGPREKEKFLAYVHERVRDKKLEPLVKNLFRPSYGGNRNYTLMYTLGGLMISSDDDMRPYALMADQPESLADDEISRGRLQKIGENGSTRKSFDMIAAFLDVLGRPAGQAPDIYERGELLVDSAMDLETNATKG